MYEVRQRFQLPDLPPFLPEGGDTARSTESWEVRRFDTTGRDLARAGVGLIQTSPAEGTSTWQLTAGGGVLAEAVAAGPDRSVPSPLVELLLGVSRGQDLRQISSVRTEQLRLVLRDASGQALVRVTDQQDSASETSGHTATLTRCRTVGATACSARSKGAAKAINRAIVAGGGRSVESADPSASATNPTGRTHRESKARRDSAASAVITYLGAQDAALIAGDLALRQGDLEVIHPLRVAVRRTRSTLRTLADCFVPGSVSAFDEDLRWYAALLGAVRDPQVQHERLRAAVAALPEEMVLGPVGARIDQHLTAELMVGRHALTEALRGERYLAFLARSAQWSEAAHLRTTPRITWSMVEDARRRAAKKAESRLRTAVVADDDAGLHGARKAAKRARYAAELAAEALGGKASQKDVKKFRRLQDLLGDHQDALVAAELLRRLGAARGIEPGENGFTYGVLHETELRLAAQARDRAGRRL